MPHLGVAIFMVGETVVVVAGVVRGSQVTSTDYFKVSSN